MIGKQNRDANHIFAAYLRGGGEVVNSKAYSCVQQGGGECNGV